MVGQGTFIWMLFASWAFVNLIHEPSEVIGNGLLYHSSCFSWFAELISCVLTCFSAFTWATVHNKVHSGSFFLKSCHLEGSTEVVLQTCTHMYNIHYMWARPASGGNRSCQRHTETFVTFGFVKDLVLNLFLPPSWFCKCFLRSVVCSEVFQGLITDELRRLLPKPCKVWAVWSLGRNAGLLKLCQS